MADGTLRFPSRRDDPSEWFKLVCTGCDTVYAHPRLKADEEFLCETCSEAQAARDRADMANRVLAARGENARADVQAALRAAGCPERYARYTRESWESAFKPWESGKVAARLIGWTGRRTPDDWLVLLYGDYGQRKTSLATALMGERLCAGESWLWVAAEELVRRLEEGVRSELADKVPGWWPSSEVWRTYAEAPGLLLDDWVFRRTAIDQGREGGWWRAELAALIRHREAHCLPTIGTANIPDTDGLGVIDPSLPRRCRVPLAIKLAAG